MTFHKRAFFICLVGASILTTVSTIVGRIVFGVPYEPAIFSVPYGIPLLNLFADLVPEMMLVLSPFLIIVLDVYLLKKVFFGEEPRQWWHYVIGTLALHLIVALIIFIASFLWFIFTWRGII